MTLSKKFYAVMLVGLCGVFGKLNAWPWDEQDPKKDSFTLKIAKFYKSKKDRSAIISERFKDAVENSVKLLNQAVKGMASYSALSGQLSDLRWKVNGLKYAYSMDRLQEKAKEVDVWAKGNLASYNLKELASDLQKFSRKVGSVGEFADVAEVCELAICKLQGVYSKDAIIKEAAHLQACVRCAFSPSASSSGHVGSSSGSHTVVSAWKKAAFFSNVDCPVCLETTKVYNLFACQCSDEELKNGHCVCEGCAKDMCKAVSFSNVAFSCPICRAAPNKYGKLLMQEIA